MTLTEQQRTDIYNSLADTTRQPGAEFLMAQQPPGGWEQLATKRDLADLETKTQAAFVEHRAALVAFNAKMDLQFAQLREQLAEQFAEIQKQFATIDTRFAAIDTRFAKVDTRFAELSERRSKEVWAIAVAIAVMTVSICGSIFLAV